LQTLGGSTLNVNITRSCSRLKTVFINFFKTITVPDTAGAPDKTIGAITKTWNYFYHPMKFGAYDKDKEVQVQVLVGNKTFPVFPIRSAAEAYYQLKKALGIHGSAFHSISIDTYKKYLQNHFIIGIDTEKVIGASFTGINCRQDLISINVKGANADLGADAPEQIYVILQPDYVVEIRESGVLVID
jgi:hypothetical protein